MNELKPSNPKDIIGSSKLPLELVPDTLVAYAALAFLEGASKYGRFNWRIAGVRASIYRAAVGRHLMKWWNGEDCDPKTGVPHLASAIAGLGIILDAELAGKLTDDRPPALPALAEMVDDAAQDVKRLKHLFADQSPRQWTIDDVEVGDEEMVRANAGSAVERAQRAGAGYITTVITGKEYLPLMPAR